MHSYTEYYLWYKAIHVIAVIAWMAALLYMPRLFVYHTRTRQGSEMDETFKIMEKKLLKIIMNPAMITTYVFGLLTAHIYGFSALGKWFHLKMFAVLALTMFHAFEAKMVKSFSTNTNKYSENFYRIINEVPAIFIIIAVVAVIVKPFE